MDCCVCFRFVSFARFFEVEKEELQNALEEAEAAVRFRLPHY